jgi:hypothetical protein
VGHARYWLQLSEGVVLASLAANTADGVGLMFHKTASDMLCGL